MNTKLKLLLITSGLFCFILYSCTLHKKDEIASTPKKNEVFIFSEKESNKVIVQVKSQLPEVVMNNANNLGKEAKSNTDLKGVIEVSHLDEIINEGEENITFDSQKVEGLSQDDTRDMLLSLTDNMTEIEPQFILDSLNEAAYFTTKNKNTFLDTVACSNKICGLLISSDSNIDVTNALNDISQTPSLTKKLKGGTLRVFEEDGIYFGLMLSALGNKPIKIK
jgi:hypothetical protein